MPVVHISAVNTSPPKRARAKKAAAKPKARGPPALPGARKRRPKPVEEDKHDSDHEEEEAAPTPSNIYFCPVYKKPHRTDLTYITTLQLNTPEETAEHWTLRGVALLCDIK